MRLLKRLPNGGVQLVPFDDDSPPNYAILSHTWAGEEVTHNDLINETGKGKAGYEKIRFCGNQAAKDSLEYFWIDSCCIDQSNTQELTTAINSMFRWYHRAAKCYVYLLDVTIPEDGNSEACPTLWLEAFKQSRWFTRGWTLQELLAPTTVEFFCKEGKRLGSRGSLEQEINQITRIPVSALRGQALTEFSIEERMSWTAGRMTTVKEDKVYCLLGIFNVFLPLIYGEGEEHATTRLREEIYRRHGGRGADCPSSLPVFSTLSFLQNEQFVGRAEELQILEKSLLHPKTHSRMAMYGLGGCGKSALAIEFAYRTLATYARLILWVPAVSRETFELAYRDIGTRLRIPGIINDDADVKKLVRDALSSANSGRWLMIVDNADDHDVLLAETTEGNKISPRLSDYLPRSDTGAILFTTRSRKMANTLSPSRLLELTSMDDTKTKQLLSRRLTNQTLLNDDASVEKLLDLLTHLPLAIVQAAAFMTNNNVSAAAYVQMLHEATAETELLSENFADQSRYEGLDSTVAKTWHISFDQIRKDDPFAADMLSFIACIDRVNIPQSLLAGTMSLVQQTKALGTLTGYAFLTEHQQINQQASKDRLFDMHRLVHLASLRWLDSHENRAAWVHTAVARLAELLPEEDGYRTKEVWTAYLSHATHVVSDSNVEGTAASALLLSRVGRCQLELGQYQAAEMVYRRSFSVIGNTHGPEHPDTVKFMSGVGVALRLQRRYAEAERLLRETLGLSKKVLGEEHQDTLARMGNLALAVCHQGNFDEAEHLQREALRLHQKVSGNHHPSTLRGMNDLGLALSARGKYAEAVELHHKTLRLCKEVFGEEHPKTLTSMSNLARSLSEHGRVSEAEAMLGETLVLNRRVLGDEHLQTLWSINNLARCLSDQKRYNEAEKMYCKALRLSEKVLGDRHPHTLITIINLGSVLGKQLRYEEARALYERAYSVLKRACGEDHVDTRNALQGYRHIVASQEQQRMLAKTSNTARAHDEDSEAAPLDDCPVEEVSALITQRKRA